MDGDKLPNEFDAVVLGTGITESILAAGLARVGWRVLHLDRYDNYGGDWASFNLNALQQWISSHKDAVQSDESIARVPANGIAALKEGERLCPIQCKSTTISNVKDAIYIAKERPASQSDETPKESGDLDSVGTSEPKPTDGSAATIPSLPASSAPETELNQDLPSADLSAPNVGPTESSDVQPAAEAGITTTSDGVNPVSEAAELDDGAGKKKTWYFSDLMKEWRKFNIDLMPKLLYSRGPLVELLISSDVAKYCEFRSVTSVLTRLNGQLKQVPCSRADVFASHDVGVIEKRMLMKLLTFCIEYEKHPHEYAGYEDKTFVDFLNSMKLTGPVRHYVQHSIAMVTDSASTIQGLRSTQKFLQSLGRYGNTAFLWPIYGSGELPQCFCRMCAVFGGVYCLRRNATSAIIDNNNKVVGVIEASGQRIDAKIVIMEASYATPEILPVSTLSRISRGILITDRSLRPDKQQHITLLSLPLPGRQDSRVALYELSSVSLVCPDGLYVVHLTCRSGSDDAETDLSPVVELLFRRTQSESSETDSTLVTDERPCVLWSLFFNVVDSTKCDLTSSLEGAIIVGGPDETIDYDHSVLEARRIFEKICPGEEFLPKAPNPEDIIYDDGENNSPKESGFEPIPEESEVLSQTDSDVGAAQKTDVEPSVVEPAAESDKPTDSCPTSEVAIE